MYVGPMWGRKTTFMLMQLEQYELQKRSVVVFKPQIDNRYSNAHIVTHSGWKHDAFEVVNGTDILRKIETLPSIPDVIAVDEAFMIHDCAKSLIWLFQKGVTIVVSSLDLSYKAKPFKEITAMFPWATSIHKCTAICDVCGHDAYYTHRKSASEEEIVIGGKDTYSARCFQHHPHVDKIPGDYE